MKADLRIQWLHKKLCEECYPNAMRLAEKFNISHRQAQRDIDFLKKELGAPIKYSNSQKGFYYTSEFSLPVVVTTEKDSEYIDTINEISGFGRLAAKQSAMQLHIPYTATVEIRDKLTVMNMRPFINAQKSRNIYECEFHSVEMFLGAIMVMESDIKILSPDWLREKLVSTAERILKNNKE